MYWWEMIMQYMACDFSSFSTASNGIKTQAKRITLLLLALSKSMQDSLHFHFHSLNGSWRLRIILLNLNHEKACRLKVKSIRKTICAQLLHLVRSQKIFLPPPWTALCHLIHLSAKFPLGPSLDLIHYLSPTETISQTAERQTCFSPQDVSGRRGPLH